MQFFIFVLIICLVLFLFRLYHLANDDYILIKKNITLEQMFNSAILCGLVSLFFARLFYVVFNPSPVLFHFLGFILFPYFPGLSLTGGLLGGILALFLLARFRKMPTGRVFDFFSLSFLFTLPVGLIGYYLLSQSFTPGGIARLVLFVLILLVANIYFYPKAAALEIKDGTSTCLFLIFFSLISLLSISIDNPGITYFINHRESFLLVGVLIVGVVLLLRQEIIGRIKYGR